MLDFQECGAVRAMALVGQNNGLAPYFSHRQVHQGLGSWEMTLVEVLVLGSRKAAMPTVCRLPRPVCGERAGVRG
jgi:hypothetical protein